MDLKDQLKNLFPEHKETAEPEVKLNQPFGYKTPPYFVSTKNEKESPSQFWRAILEPQQILRYLPKKLKLN